MTTSRAMMMRYRTLAAIAVCLALCPRFAGAQIPPPNNSVLTTTGNLAGVGVYCWNGSSVSMCGDPTAPAFFATLAVAMVKASPGAVFGLSVSNPNAATTYIQFYNNASPVLGTGVQWVIAVPANGTVNLAPGDRALAAFTTAIGVGASSTPGTGVAPTTAPAVTVFFK
jgi:hypothetical protein